MDQPTVQKPPSTHVLTHSATRCLQKVGTVARNTCRMVLLTLSPIHSGLDFYDN